MSAPTPKPTEAGSFGGAAGKTGAGGKAVGEPGERTAAGVGEKAVGGPIGRSFEGAGERPVGKPGEAGDGSAAALPATPALSEEDALQAACDEFITQWGTMGSAWGVNRTMAQIHALLLTSTTSLTTDEIMDDLRISRGNANMNLRELCGWGLIRSVIRKGERKEYFEAEKDVWKMFCIIIRERKRREIRPAINVLKECAARTASLKSPEAIEFTKEITALSGFMEMADSVLSKVVRSEGSTVVPWALKFLK